jgi:hypothetical protein
MEIFIGRKSWKSRGLGRIEWCRSVFAGRWTCRSPQCKLRGYRPPGMRELRDGPGPVVLPVSVPD